MINRLAAATVLIAAGSAGADPQLLGLCSVLEEARCASSTSWSVEKTTSTPILDGTANAPARFTIKVTEGLTATAISVRGVVTLTGLIPGGTAVAMAGLGFCLWLLSTRTFTQAWILAALIVAGWLLGRIARGKQGAGRRGVESPRGME